MMYATTQPRHRQLTSAAPMMPWGARDTIVAKCGDFFH
jgi:hypothetical protein